MVLDIALQDLERELRQLGYSVDPERLQRCRSICNAFKISNAASFVNRLHSYFLGTEISESGRRKVDDVLLESFETSLVNSNETGGKRSNSYTKANLNELEEDILEFYCSSETKEKIKAKQFEDGLRAQQSLQSHSELLCSPTKQQRNDFKEREDKGKVEVRFCPDEIEFKFSSQNNSFELLTCIEEYKKYGNKIYSVADSLNALIERKENDLLHLVRKVEQNDEIVFSHPLQSCTEEFYTAGMISIDKAQGQVFLQTSKQTGMNARIALKLDQCDSYSLFPGKVVAIKGKTLDTLTVNVAVLYEPEKSKESSHNETQKDVSLVIACGPYCFDDGLHFEPLDEFLLSISKECNFVVVIGPFLDENNSAIQKGNLKKFPELILLEEIFERRIFPFCKANPQIKVLVVPSPKEASPFISSGCLPQPPINLSLLEEGMSLDVPDNLVFLPNPCELILNGSLRLSMLNSDVLFNLSKEELVKNPPFPTDRMTRICNYLLEQESFCPLMQPSNIEFVQLHKLQMSHLPDILIAPSSLRHFVKQLNDRLLINPGQLCRSQAGGVFCQLKIDSTGKKKVSINKV